MDWRPHIVVVEDEAAGRQLLIGYLSKRGYRVTGFASGVGLRRMVEREIPNLVLLDIGLPGEDGLALARWLREKSSKICIIMVTAAGETVDRIVGLESGADDYIPKPFEPRELLARLRAVLRRPALAAAGTAAPLRFGRLELDRGARAVRVDGEPRAVTSYQFDLLLALAERAGRVLTREQLLDAVRGEAIGPFDRSIDVHVGRLRAAIEDDPKHPRRILTVRGVGYVFARDQNG